MSGQFEIVRAPFGSPEWERAQRFVYDEYLQLGWCEPNPTGRVAEYVDHDDVSTMYLGFDGGALVATSRAVDGAWDDMPTAHAAAAVSLFPGSWRDVGGLVADPGYRGGVLGTEMWRIAAADGIAAGVTGVCFATHVGIVDGVEAMGVPVRRIGEPVMHLGSVVQAAAVVIDEFRDRCEGSDVWTMMTDTDVHLMA